MTFNNDCYLIPTVGMLGASKMFFAGLQFQSLAWNKGWVNLVTYTLNHGAHFYILFVPRGTITLTQFL